MVGGRGNSPLSSPVTSPSAWGSWGTQGTFAYTLRRFFFSLLSSPWVSSLLAREETVREWKATSSRKVKLPLRAKGRGV